MRRRAKKTETPETLAGQCMAHRLRLMHRVVMGIYDEALRAEGVDMRVSQMNILVQVMLAGPNVTSSDLCEAMKIDASTVSRNVERLIARGWLRTEPGEDERSHVLVVTAKGKRLLEKGVVAWRKAQKQTAALVGEDGVAAIHRLAEKMLRGKKVVM